MGLLTKEDLKLDGYSWTVFGGDDARVTGVPDSTLFNRNEGYEVLSLINAFAGKNGLKIKASGQKAERMIRQHLPSDVRSRKNVMAWLKQHWATY